MSASTAELVEALRIVVEKGPYAFDGWGAAPDETAYSFCRFCGGVAYGPHAASCEWRKVEAAYEAARS